MLQTLIEIGKQVSMGRGEWDDIIDKPDVSKEKGKGMRLFVATMFFDLDLKEIILDEDSLREYDEEDPFKFKNIKIQGGNNKAIYTTVFAPKSLEQFCKTFFGIINKEGQKAGRGQFSEAIEKGNLSLKSSLLAKSLESIFELKDAFEAKFIDVEKNVFLSKKLHEQLSLGKQDIVILLVASVKCSSLGILNPVLLCEIEGYEDFIRTKFLEPSKKAKTQKRICYATGILKDDVGEIAFNSRYNINKMFVTTTRNYASEFANEGFNLNYQASSETQKLLERGSEYILQNHTTLIAGVNHCILPKIFSQSKVYEKSLLARLSKKSELLFRAQETQDLISEIEVSEPEIYWIDFLGYESDGNFFKAINYIRDVSKLHFTNLIHTFQNVDRFFKDIDGIDWENVMSRGKERLLFLNFQTFYSLIPIRKEKEKKNEALIAFKSILEQRPFSRYKLFEYYKELILCHRFHRYRSYTNIYAPENINDRTLHFDYAIRNATYQYLAIFQVLKQLNLLKDMEEITNAEPAIVGETFQQQIDVFFHKMDYSESQKAMFYLGRAVSAVAYAQVQKNHSSKPILDKINFNGLDTKAIMRLHNDLMEKTRQYRIYEKTELSLSSYLIHFNVNNWKLSPEEALFFLLSGYSFRIQSAKKNQD